MCCMPDKISSTSYLPCVEAVAGVLIPLSSHVPEKLQTSRVDSIRETLVTWFNVQSYQRRCPGALLK